MPLFKPSNFRADSYGYFTNQNAHALYVGLVVFCVGGCALYFWAFGTFPYRLHMWIAGTVGYFIYELVDQGWKGWDTIEDTGYVSFGFGAPLYTFRQVSEGSTMITGDLMDAVPFAIALSAFLVTGSLIRWYESRMDT